MENREIEDKIYYLSEASNIKNKKPDFFYCNIIADKSHLYGDTEQFNKYVLYLMSELSKDRLVESFICEVNDAQRYFVPGKMIAGIYKWEVEKKGWLFKKKETYTNVATLSKDNEFMKFSERVYEYEWFSTLIFPYKEVNFNKNDPQTVIDYANSEDYMFSIVPEIVTPVCRIEVNTKYISKEEFIHQLTQLTENIGEKLEVEI
jgi:hypothetical protein